MDYVAPGYCRSGYSRLDSDSVGDFIFDGWAKRIYVNNVNSITVQDMYSRWLQWSFLDTEDDNNTKWPHAMRYSGFEPIPGGFTGTTYFLFNGWKVMYDPNITSIFGVLFSEDYSTPLYDKYSNLPLFPVQVAALVSTVSVTQNIVTGTVLTAEQTANAVWDASITNRAGGTVGNYLYNKILTVAKFLGLK